MNILVADDDKIQTLMLSRVLKAKGYKVATAYDAIQAWTAAIRTIPDAIILDIQMPGGTGIAVLKQLKTSTKTNQIPVIVLSGSIDPNASGSVLELGADRFLQKPVDPNALFSCLSDLLGVPATPPNEGQKEAA